MGGEDATMEGTWPSHRDIHRAFSYCSRRHCVGNARRSLAPTWRRDARRKDTATSNDRHTSSLTISRNCVDRRGVEGGALRGSHSQQVTVCSAARRRRLAETRRKPFPAAHYYSIYRLPNKTTTLYRLLAYATPVTITLKFLNTT